MLYAPLLALEWCLGDDVASYLYLAGAKYRLGGGRDDKKTPQDVMIKAVSYVFLIPFGRWSRAERQRSYIRPIQITAEMVITGANKYML